MPDSVNGGVGYVDQVLTREQFERGAIVWGGACCQRRPYELLKELPDGRVLARGLVNQEPTCEIERQIVALMDANRARWKEQQARGAVARRR